jgi:catechol 2,3-dioxygenase-like lactoylglutathione lyase family enzyme
MIDHLSLGVNDLKLARDFYDAALKPLGIKRQAEFPGMYGYGPTTEQVLFWIGVPDGGRWANACPGTHVAFAAPSRAAVRAFHKAALGAGGRDNGKPGLRPDYHPNYYGAFIIDPAGHHVEAVCHTAER